MHPIMSDNNNFPAVDFTYDSHKRKSPALEEMQDIIQYKDLIFQLVRRDVVARYKRSVLGIAWTMLQPLGTMAVLAIVFSQLFGQLEGYTSYLISGLVAWTFFSQSTTAAIYHSVWGGVLIRKIHIPHTSFPISSVGTAVINLSLSLIPLLLIFLATRRPVTSTVLFLPVAIFLLAAFALGVSLLLSSIAVYFPDISDMYQIVVQAWMYLTPIMYPESILPEAYRDWLTHLNPMYYLINIFRYPLYNGSLPPMDVFLTGGAISLATLIIGWIFFSYRADEFAYHI
jgi:ABC-type polysaccharide/polyol phosphate export permease